MASEISSMKCVLKVKWLEEDLLGQTSRGLGQAHVYPRWLKVGALEHSMRCTIGGSSKKSYARTRRSLVEKRSLVLRGAPSYSEGFLLCCRFEFFNRPHYTPKHIRLLIYFFLLKLCSIGSIKFVYDFSYSLHIVFLAIVGIVLDLVNPSAKMFLIVIVQESNYLCVKEMFNNSSQSQSTPCYE